MKRVLLALMMLAAPVFLYSARVIVKYNDSFEKQAAEYYAKANGLPGADRDSVISAIEKAAGLKKIKPHLEGKVPFFVYESDSDTNTALAMLSIPGIIEYAEPNHIRQAMYAVLPGGPNDPYYQTQTGMYSPGQWGYSLVSADAAYAAGYLNSLSPVTVTVAVCDTGVDAHPELVGVLVQGINAIDGTGNTDDDSVDSGNQPEGHGTMCAGIIAAQANNSYGIAGAARGNGTSNVAIMPVKVLNSDGTGDDADIYYGISWAADRGADVINLSLGGSGTSTTLQNAITYALTKGCVLVAASGNWGSDVPVYPAYYSGCISVGSVDKDDNVSYFTSYAKVDVSAPGGDGTDNIWSTYNAGGFREEAGTSLAAPFVSALAAAIMFNKPGIRPESVRDIIQHSADDINEPGYDKKTGWGRINFYRALSGDSVSYGSIKTYPWPNPFSPEKDAFCNIVFVLEKKAGVEIGIFDAAGRPVKVIRLNENEVSTGHNTIRWDGLNTNKKLCGNGTYFYTVRSGKLLGKNKLSVLK